MNTINDPDILSLLAKPNERQHAFTILVNEYSKPLYWKIRTIVANHDDADDILQNTFLKAWKALDDFQGKSKLSTWLYRIAINEALDFLRHQKGKLQIGEEGENSLANTLVADEYFDGDDGQAILQEAIATLPEVQRTVFTLRYFEEMKYAEMSKILDTSEGALKASYHIAVQKITDYVKKKE